MMKRFACVMVSLASAALLFTACGGSSDEDPGPNPLLEVTSDPGKADTAYYNPEGIEVEVDLEGVVEGPSYKMWDGPAELAQYAMTYLRNRGQFYLEGVAECATSDERVEWLVDEEWITAAEARQLGTDSLSRWRLRGVNAVLLHGAASGVDLGSQFSAEVPIKPFTTFADAGEDCVDVDHHLGLSQSIYWYMWNPDKSACEVPTQQMQLTVSKMMASKVTYPEYDQLVADGQVSLVILFGQIGDDPLTDSDSGVRNMNRFARWLDQAGYEESEAKPVEKGRRFAKTFNGVEIRVDLYSPYDFSGLGDYAHLSNFQQAISDNEVVAYDGHSMLGASDFWSRPSYPDFYQIFLYGGCLGYEYYVRPIFEGKGGWDKLDILSSVVEVSAPANDYAGAFLGKLQYALEHDYDQSWKSILGAVRSWVGDSTFGMSGVRDNCFSPSGSLCGPEPDPETTQTFASAEVLDIPDDAPAGVSGEIQVPDSLPIASLSLELDVSHSYVGDLRITLSHGGTEAVVWDRAGGSAQDIHQSFSLTDFDGTDAQGTWTLTVSDNAAQDVGSVDSWKLIISPQQ